MRHSVFRKWLSDGSFFPNGGRVAFSFLLEMHLPLKQDLPLKQKNRVCIKYPHGISKKFVCAEKIVPMSVVFLFSMCVCVCVCVCVCGVCVCVCVRVCVCSVCMSVLHIHILLPLVVLIQCITLPHTDFFCGSENKLAQVIIVLFYFACISRQKFRIILYGILCLIVGR